MTRNEDSDRRPLGVQLDALADRHTVGLVAEPTERMLAESTHRSHAGWLVAVAAAALLVAIPVALSVRQSNRGGIETSGPPASNEGVGSEEAKGSAGISSPTSYSMSGAAAALPTSHFPPSIEDVFKVDHGDVAVLVGLSIEMGEVCVRVQTAESGSTQCGALADLGTGRGLFAVLDTGSMQVVGGLVPDDVVGVAASANDLTVEVVANTFVLPLGTEVHLDPQTSAGSSRVLHFDLSGDPGDRIALDAPDRVELHVDDMVISALGRTGCALNTGEPMVSSDVWQSRIDYRVGTVLVDGDIEGVRSGGSAAVAVYDASTDVVSVDILEGRATLRFSCGGSTVQFADN